MATRLVGVLTTAIAAVGLIGVGASAPAVASPSAAGEARGQLTVVQALPGASVGVEVDGRTVRGAADVGTLVGPLALPAGKHTVTFTGVPGGDVSTEVRVAPRSDTDAVLHLPASADGDPVVHTYVAPVGPIGPGKSRLLVAHTATVAPADVQVDGTVVFDNIANGEFARSVVPSGAHRVAIFATGTDTDPLLGPVDVALKPRTATMVYAYGNPTDGSMNVVAHTLALAGDGSVVPTSVHTGSAGLVGDVAVTGFGPSLRGTGRAGGPVAGPLLGAAGALVALGGLLGVRRRRVPVAVAHRGSRGGAHRPGRHLTRA